MIPNLLPGSREARRSADAPHVALRDGTSLGQRAKLCGVRHAAILCIEKRGMTLPACWQRYPAMLALGQAPPAYASIEQQTPITPNIIIAP